MSKTSKIIMLSIIGLFLALFITGTFVDFEINKAIFSPKHPVTLSISVISNTLGYGMFAYLGGGAIYFGKAYNLKKQFKILLYIASVILYGCGVFFAGREVFGENGFGGVAPGFVGYFVVAPFDALFLYLGYKVVCKTDNPHLWVTYLVLVIAMAIVFLLLITAAKSLMHRPRYRGIYEYGHDLYLPWYTRCSNYKELMEIYDLSKEEFKSFPSGHSASAMLIPMYSLFLTNTKKSYKKASMIIFPISFAFGLTVMFSRMHLGAHYLSDVSFGALMTVTMFFVSSLYLSNLYKKRGWDENIIPPQNN